MFKSNSTKDAGVQNLNYLHLDYNMNLKPVKYVALFNIEIRADKFFQNTDYERAQEISLRKCLPSLSRDSSFD